jgi:hypothetical protein
MARTLQLRNQFGIRMSRLFVLRLGRAQPFRQIGVDLFLVPR